MRRKLTVLVLGVLAALAVCSIGIAGAARDTGAIDGGSNAPIELWIGDVSVKDKVFDSSWGSTANPAFWTGPGSSWVVFRIRGENQTGTVITIQCKLDTAAWRTCWKSGPLQTNINGEKRFEGIKPGWHTIRIRAVDAAGSVLPTTPFGGHHDVVKWWVG